MKILLIEDEPGLRSAIAEYLHGDGFHVEQAGTYAEGAAKVRAFTYDCLLIDITLPGGSGLDLVDLAKRAHPRAGLIVISARDAVEDKVRGLDLGADDYLAKPFHLSELTARIKALVRRKSYDGAREVRYREIAVDLDALRVTVAGAEVHLTRSEQALLLFFLANAGRVVSKEALAETIVGDHAASLVSLDFLYSHVKNLRKKITDAGGGDYVAAVYGLGYRWGER